MIAGYAAGVSKVNRDRLGNKMLAGGLADGLPMSELGKAARPRGQVGGER